jgi:two-component system sensor histidine kinase ChvG
VAAVRYSFFQVSLGVLVVTILIGYFLSRSITRPIAQLAKAADEVRMSNTKQITLPQLVKRNDEIGELARDITLMTQDLQDRAVATAGFAADVAHEIKNPLTSLRSAVETLDRVKTPDQQKRLLEVIKSDVIRLDRLISDISAASRIDRDLSEATYETVDLNELTQGFVEARRLSHTHLHLDLTLTDKPVFVHVAVDRIVQIMDNLLSNAASFSVKGGHIIFSVSVEGRQAVLSVSDEGIGIPDAKLAAIFDRFYSERPSGEGFGKHSGLGLSISLKIAEAHGGSMTASNRRNDEGKVIGAELRLVIPLSRGEDKVSVS